MTQPVSDHIAAEMDAALRTKALESLLIEKGLISTDSIDAIVRLYEQDIGPLKWRESGCQSVDRPRLQTMASGRWHSRNR